MRKIIVTACFALAVAAGTIGAVGAKPAQVELPAASQAAPAIDLKAATGQTEFGSWYCSKMQDRCDNGDANACALVAKYCSN